LVTPGSVFLPLSEKAGLGMPQRAMASSHAIRGCPDDRRRVVGVNPRQRRQVAYAVAHSPRDIADGGLIRADVVEIAHRLSVAAAPFEEPGRRRRGLRWDAAVPANMWVQQTLWESHGGHRRTAEHLEHDAKPVMARQEVVVAG
jgi:hypothetical protein